MNKQTNVEMGRQADIRKQMYRQTKVEMGRQTDKHITDL